MTTTDTRIRPIMILLFICLLGLAPLSETVYMPALPIFTDIFHISNAEAKYSAVIYTFSFGLCQLLYGYFVGNIGIRKLVFSGLIIYILGVIVILSSHTYPEILIGRFVQGAGISAGSVLVRVAMKENYDLQQQRKYFPVILGIVGLLPVFGPTIGGSIIRFSDWRYIFVLLLFLAMGALALALLKFPNVSITHPKQRLMNLSYFFPNVTFIKLVIIGSLLLSTVLLYSIEGPFLLIQKLGFSPFQYGLITLSTASSYLLGTLITSRFFIQHHIRHIKVIGATLSTLGCVILFILSAVHPLSLSILIPPMLVIMVGIGIAKSRTSIAAMNAHPLHSGQTSSLLGFWQMLISSTIIFCEVHFMHITLFHLSIIFLAAFIVIDILIFWLPKQIVPNP